MNYSPMVDDTKSGILKHEADEAYRRLQRGFEALRPAFSCNRKVTSGSGALSQQRGMCVPTLLKVLKG